METSNVNNLNGIPNFGHGFPDTPKEVDIPAEVEEEAPRKKGRKLTEE